MNHYASLLLGIASAGFGGELFIRGTLGLARWLRIPPGIVGATVAAFATSSPELSVAIGAALAGQPEISLGDALGSNVVNVALILALALLVSPIRASRGAVKRDFPVALLVPFLTFLLALDGRISRIDALLMLAVFLGWCIASVNEARTERTRAAQSPLGEHKAGRALLFCALGMAFLILAGKLIVLGARGVALELGMGEFAIGATVVAFGTSVPELATTLIAKLRGHDDIGLGTVLGSNIFNGVFIVPVAAFICPIGVHGHEVSLALAFGVGALLCVFPPKHGFLGRRRGALLLALYLAYLTAILGK